MCSVYHLLGLEIRPSYSLHRPIYNWLFILFKTGSFQTYNGYAFLFGLIVEVVVCVMKWPMNMSTFNSVVFLSYKLRLPDRESVSIFVGPQILLCCQCPWVCYWPSASDSQPRLRLDGRSFIHFRMVFIQCVSFSCVCRLFFFVSSLQYIAVLWLKLQTPRTKHTIVLRCWS